MAHKVRSLAVVTGASTGIGYALAKCCIRNGFDLIIAAGAFDRAAGFASGHRAVIRRSSAAPDVLYGFGHGHVGITGAPMTARILAELVSGETPALDIEPFSPRRFM